MATVKSDIITDQDAQPIVKTPSGRNTAERRVLSSKVATAVEDDVAILCKINGAARVYGIYPYGGDFKSIGLYSRNVDGTYTVVDADAYSDGGSGIALGGAQVNFAFDARTLDKGGQTVSDDAGAPVTTVSPPDYYIGAVVGVGGFTNFYAEIVYALD